jgi:hypothetical protein
MKKKQDVGILGIFQQEQLVFKEGNPQIMAADVRRCPRCPKDGSPKELKIQRWRKLCSR